MKTIVFGLGYVGTVVTACLIKARHSVLGIDTNDLKCARLAQGLSPVFEPDVESMLLSGVKSNLLAASTTIEDSRHSDISDIDVVIVCVGTPEMSSGDLDITQVLAVSNQIGHLIAERINTKKLLCIFRSTLPPGTVEGFILPAIESVSGRVNGDGYEVVYNPEFLREGTAVKDFFDPPKIVLGERKKGVSKRARGLYQGIDAPFFEVSYKAAEFSKILDNSFHALKVAFANEIGRIAQFYKVSTDELLDPFLRDTKLNISSTYLTPGGAFGGSCLPKDVGALVYLSKKADIDVSLLDAILPSNEAHKKFMLNLVESNSSQTTRLLLVGLSFKADTDDLRNSPLVDLANGLLSKGYNLRVYDPDILKESLTGKNLEFFESRLPGINDKILSERPAFDEYDLIIIGKQLFQPQTLPKEKVLYVNKL